MLFLAEMYEGMGMGIAVGALGVAFMGMVRIGRLNKDVEALKEQVDALKKSK